MRKLARGRPRLGILSARARCDGSARRQSVGPASVAGSCSSESLAMNSILWKHLALQLYFVNISEELLLLLRNTVMETQLLETTYCASFSMGKFTCIDELTTRRMKLANDNQPIDQVKLHRRRQSRLAAPKCCKSRLHYPQSLLLRAAGFPDV